ncbi:MAG: S8 family serine peptidase, partial [Acidobacteriota bacterium]
MIKGRTPVAGRKRAPAYTKRLEFVPGQIIVRVRQSAVPPPMRAARLKFVGAEAKALPPAIAEPLDYLRRNAGLKLVQPLFSTRRAAIQRASVSTAERHRLAMWSSVADSESEELRGIAVLSVDPKKATPKLMKHIGAAQGVEFAEPMPARWLAQAGADPMQNLQWGLRAIQWFGAVIPDAKGVKVGVLDSGIDDTHPDLADVDIEYHHEGLKAQDLVGHGTHVCGIIAAATNNQTGITGVAACKLEVWKIFPDAPEEDGEFYVDGVRYLRALQALIGADVKVVNLSISGTASSQTEALLFRRLHDRKITVVAAMGNEYEEGNPTEYPAAYKDVFSIGSIAEDRRRSSFSNTGRHIDLVAPGSNILSTVPTKGSPFLDETDYASWSGTSMATPHVAAAAALVAAKHPHMDATQIKEKLRSTATKLPAMRNRAWTPA